MNKHAIIVSHGQPSAPDPAQAALDTIAAQVQELMPDWCVHSATLAKPGRLDAVMQAAERRPIVYPFFMSRGWFVTGMLAQRLNSYDYELLDPFGLERNLPSLAAAAICAEINRLGWTVQHTDLLLAAHGSGRGNRAAEAAYDFAEKLNERVSLKSLTTGFVEQTPYIRESARALGPNSLCLPFFAQSGDHVREDIPEGLGASAHEVRQMPALGALPGVPDLIARTLGAA